MEEEERQSWEWKGKGDEEERGGGVWMWKEDGVVSLISIGRHRYRAESIECGVHPIVRLVLQRRRE